MPNNNYRYPSWYVYDPTPWRENDTEWRTPWDSPYNGALGYDHGDHSDGANEGISKYDIFIGGMLVSWWLLVCFALWIGTVRNVRSRTPALEAYSLARRAAYAGKHHAAACSWLAHCAQAVQSRHVESRRKKEIDELLQSSTQEWSVDLAEAVDSEPAEAAARTLECTLCLEDFQPAETVLKLPCG